MQKNLANFLTKISASIINSGREAEHQYIPLGWIGLISFIAYLFIWKAITPDSYDNFILRLIGGIFCLILIIKNYWPIYLQRFKPYFWYCTLLYCFPFFFTYMMLKNPTSYVWIMTIMTGTFFLMLLTRLSYFIILQLLGFLLALLFCKLFNNNIHLPSIFIKTLPTYFTVIVAGIIFLQRDHQVIKEKIQLLKQLASSIAHELRTPLTSIDGSAKGLSNYLPIFWEAYGLAEKSGLPVKFISPLQLEAIQNSVKDIKNEASSAFLIIDMLLKAVHLSDFDFKNFKICSIKACVNEALERYTYPIGQREVIKWDNNEDFLFLGDPTLTQHIIFNLLKNSFYHLGNLEKNHIEIWIEKKEQHLLYFRDTGEGISPDMLLDIFKPFLTTTPHGTGIGLSFCKSIMEAYGGDIECYSEVGKYTEFVLTFPSLKPI